MPHDEWGNYYEYGFLESLGFGLFIVAALVVVLSIPGWISAAIWGWTWFFRGAAIFWLSAIMITLVGMTLAVIGSGE